MHRSGNFDVTDDASSPRHVIYSRPIRKSLLHLRPEKYFHRSCSEDATIADACKLVPGLPVQKSTSDGTSSTKQEANYNQNHQPASEFTNFIIGENSAERCHLPPPATTVSKSGTESSQPEVKYSQIQATSSLERSGSLRDRWRLLNEEFKRVYQQNSSQATPPQGHGGQRRVTKVNRFKDVDERFSNVSRVVGNMSARQARDNSTSGRQMTSSKQPEVAGSWYPGSRDDERQGKQSSVAPSGECEYKTVCTRCGKTFTTTGASSHQLDYEDGGRMPQARDSYREDTRPARRLTQRSRDAEVDDVTVGPEVAILTRGGAWDARGGTTNRKQEKSERNWKRYRTVRRRCSCGCDPSPSPTDIDGVSPVDHVVTSRPEEEITRSRDAPMTSSPVNAATMPGYLRGKYNRWASKSGRVKQPAIEMNRQQVLRVYVLKGETGSGVRGHVTHPPADCSQFSTRAPQGVADFPTKTQRIRTNPTVPATNLNHRSAIPNCGPDFYTSNYQQDPVIRSLDRRQAQSRSFGELRRSGLTLRSPSVVDRSSTRTSSARSSETPPSSFYLYRPVKVFGTASLDRRSVDSSGAASRNKFYSSRTAPSPQQVAPVEIGLYGGDRNVRLLSTAGMGTASLDRRCCEDFGRNSDLDGEELEDSCWAEGNSNTRCDVYGDRSRPETKGRLPPSCVEANSNIARGRTARRQDSGTVSDRRVRSASRNDHQSVQDLHQTYRPKSTSLEREHDLSRHRPRPQPTNTLHPSQSNGINGLTTANPLSEDDWMNPRWVKRQIHLPSKQRRLKTSADFRRPDQKLLSGRGLVMSSRTDPDNVCFSQRSDANMAERTSIMVPARTVRGQQIGYRSPSNVCVRFATDDNGNLVKVTEISQVVTETVDHLDDSCHDNSDVEQELSWRL